MNSQHFHYPCGRHIMRPYSRREMLTKYAHGFGALALSVLSQSNVSAQGNNPLGPKLSHYPGRAKNVIFLYMDGGPSQVDMFDHKPMLEKYDGQDPKSVIGKLTPTQFASIGKILKSPWSFKNYGDSGHQMSSLLPNIGSVADDLAFVKSMHVESAEHTSANYFMHTGSVFQGHPSMGAWFSYGLGSENENLPGFVVIKGRKMLVGGLNNFGSGFLPSSFQGSVLLPQKDAVANISRSEPSEKIQRNKLDLIRQFDEKSILDDAYDPEIEAAIQNYETAFKMQTAVPELMHLESEAAETRRLYGLDSKFEPMATFGTQCLIARRLVERGVRFVELACSGAGDDRWDQHGSLHERLPANCKTIDQPIAGLIKDLKRRGMLDSTLVVWTGEFGRTPFAQGTNGRDHNPDGFTLWMAGGGIKGGVSYGATDEWGYKAIENRSEVYDLHATMLHLMGIDHKRNTFRFSGRDMRLTDVHGNIIQEILA